MDNSNKKEKIGDSRDFEASNWHREKEEGKMNAGPVSFK